MLRGTYLVVVAGALTAVASWAQGQEMVANGGMEGDYVSGVAPGWFANCYGEFEVRFEKDSAQPHSGKAAQKIVCTRFERGGIQIRCGGVNVAKGRMYTLQAWLRGEDLKSPVLLCIRKHGKPYTKYLAQYVRVSDRWRRFTVIGPASDTDDDCGIYIWFGSTGTLWIDDVSLRPGAHRPTTASVEAAPVKGNRIYNSSFEIGLAGWVGGDVIEGGYQSGRALSLGRGQWAESRPFTVTPGQLHTVSLYARAAHERAKLHVEVVEYADLGGDRPVQRHKEAAEFVLTTGWERYHFQAVLEAPFTRGYMLRLRATEPVAVDSVQVEEGGLTEYVPMAPIEVALRLPVLARYLRPMQPVQPEVVVWAPGRSGQDLRLRLAWQDFFGSRRAAGEGTVAIGPDGTGRTRIRCRGQQFGIYRLQATAEGKCAPGEVVMGVLPADDGKRVPDSFFGTHAHMNPSTDNVALHVARRAGMRWYRLHDFNHHVQWIHCEPDKKGKFSWADEEIGDVHGRGFELVGTLVRTPKWAGREYPADRPAIVQARVPRKLEWYADYVRAVVGRYRDRIKHWEMWNEPYGWGFWAGTPEEYVQLENLGYDAAKAADPTCRVIGMCVYPGVRSWIERAVRAGGLRPLDILSFHVYISPAMVEPRGKRGRSAIEEGVRYLRMLLREEGREDVPIWDTEGGVGCPSFYSWLPPDGYRWDWREAAATVPKAVAQLMAAGVEKWFYYFVGFAGGGSGSYHRMNNIAYVEIDIDGSPKATLLAHAAAARLLDRSVYTGKIAAGPVVAYVFERQGSATGVLWTRQDEQGEGGQAVEISLPRELLGAQVYDVMGRSRRAEKMLRVDEVPVYLMARMSGRRLRLLLRRALAAIAK